MSDGVALEITGFQEMIDALDAMGKEGDRVFKEALDEGVKPILSAMQRRAPTKTGFLKVNIKVGTVKKNKNGVWSQVVGPAKGDITAAYYGKFSEYGSVHEPARPWMRPAFDESKDKAYKIIETKIQDGLDRAFNKK
jgi:HK97 gp10 family phage protein